MKISRLLFLSLLTLWTRMVFADANTTISAAEYFVDTDPGEGSGTALTAQDGAFDSEVEAIAPVDFNVTGLSVGPHLIGIRYKDNNNTWGEVLYQTIHVYDANPSADQNVTTRLEAENSNIASASSHEGVFTENGNTFVDLGPDGAKLTFTYNSSSDLNHTIKIRFKTKGDARAMGVFINNVSNMATNANSKNLNRIF